MEPDWMCRNKPFGKPDHAGAFGAGLGDQAAGLFDRCLAIEKDRGRLNRGDTHRLIVIAHCVSLSGRPQRALYYDAKSRAKQCRGRSTIDICALFSYAAGSAYFDQVDVNRPAR